MNDESKKTSARWFKAILAVGCAALVVNVVISMLHRTRERAGVPCSSHLRQLGQAILLYAHDHEKRFPDSIEDVLVTIDISPEVLICPGSQDSRADGTTSAEIAAKVRMAGLPTFDSAPSNGQRHCSYIYCGRGFTSDTIKPDMVLMYEPLSNHESDGINVVFGDGSSMFLSRDEAIKLIASLPTTRPVTK